MAAEPRQPPPTRLEYSSGKLHIHFDDPASSSSPSPNEATSSRADQTAVEQQAEPAGSAEAVQHMRPQEVSGASVESAAQKMVDVLQKKGLEVEWPGSLDKPVVVNVPEGGMGSLRSRLQGDEEDAAEDDDWVWDVLQVYAEEI